MQTYYHITPSTNLAAIKREGLKPSIGPRSKFAAKAAQDLNIPEHKPAIYLFSKKTDATDAERGWFAAWEAKYRAQESSFALLAVSLTAAEKAQTESQALDCIGQHVGLVCHFHIPASRIKVLGVLTPKPTEVWNDEDHSLKGQMAQLFGEDFDETN